MTDKNQNASPKGDFTACPTPWCSKEDQPYTWQGPDDKWMVICSTCNVEGPNCNTESEAIAAWNTRSQAKAPDDLREAVANEHPLFAKVCRAIWESDPDLCRPAIAQIHARAALSVTDARLREAVEIIEGYLERSEFDFERARAFIERETSGE